MEKVINDLRILFEEARQRIEFEFVLTLLNPILTEKQQQALQAVCEALEKNDTLETIEKMAQFLASLAGVASYIQHLLS